MEKPTKEHLMYGQLNVAESVMEHIFDNVEESIFETTSIIDLIARILKEMSDLRNRMKYAFLKPEK